jgi:glutamine synthetase
MACLLHEKPFAGINGSGKHLNWSLGTKKANLLEPGDTPHSNMQFLAFCSAVIRAVDKHASLLRASVAHAGNDHRLGANEAPPAIISIFLGDQLTEVFENIAKGDGGQGEEAGRADDRGGHAAAAAEGRGRPQPDEPVCVHGQQVRVPGGGFEPVGGGPAGDPERDHRGFDRLHRDELEAAKAKTPEALGAAVQKVIQKIMKEHGRIIFNGDGYTESWQKEAAKRGLPNARNTADAIPACADEGKRRGAREVQRAVGAGIPQPERDLPGEVRQGSDDEARLAFEIAKTMIFPAAVEYQNRLAGTSIALKTLGKKHCTTVLDELSGLVADFQGKIEELRLAIAHEAKGDVVDHARHCRDEISPAMLAVRQVADQLEGIVADDLWPLPTYQEMLFIK